MGHQCCCPSWSHSSSCPHRECHRMLASLLPFAALLLLAAGSSNTVWAASPSTSFGISAPVPLPSEALSIGDTAASWAKSTGSNNHGNQVGSLNERSSTTGKTVGMSKSSSPSVGNCDKLHLTPRQKQLCVQGGDGLAETLFEAIRLSAVTCQQQFEYERWNCTLQGQSRLLTLKKAYRETAALYAFSAAGVVHAVARACAAGRLRKCHCAEAENEVETRQTWRWGGCGDNLAYAKAFARKFLDAGSPTDGNGRKASNPSPSVGKSKMKKKKSVAMRNEMEALSRSIRKWKRSMPTNAVAAGSSSGRRSSSQSGVMADASVSDSGSSKKHKSDSQRQRINRHNNGVGIQVVERLVNRTCKCHGVSGSCSVRTCWHQLAAFSETAAVIKVKYQVAAQVSSEISENSSHLRSGNQRHPSSSSVVYYQHHHDPVSSNQPATKNRAKKALKGSNPTMEPTTMDRQLKQVKKDQLIFQQRSPDYCSASPLGPGTANRVCQSGDNCGILCCGRGYNIHKMTIMTACRCKLILCCRVECQNCLVDKIVHTCKK